MRILRLNFFAAFCVLVSAFLPVSQAKMTGAKTQSLMNIKQFEVIETAGRSAKTNDKNFNKKVDDKQKKRMFIVVSNTRYNAENVNSVLAIPIFEKNERNAKISSRYIVELQFNGKNYLAFTNKVQSVYKKNAERVKGFTLKATDSDVIKSQISNIIG